MPCSTIIGLDRAPEAEQRQRQSPEAEPLVRTGVQRNSGASSRRRNRSNQEGWRQSVCVIIGADSDPLRFYFVSHWRRPMSLQTDPRIALGVVLATATTDARMCSSMRLWSPGIGSGRRTGAPCGFGEIRSMELVQAVWAHRGMVAT